MLTELLVLKMVELGLGTLWMGGDHICFSSTAIRRVLNSKNQFPIVIALGYAAGEYVRRSRKAEDKIAINWPKEQDYEFELINRAPSAINL